jgi:hypothetical protein
MKLASIGIAIDTPTEERHGYVEGWEMGTPSGQSRNMRRRL